MLAATRSPSRTTWRNGALFLNGNSSFSHASAVFRVANFSAPRTFSRNRCNSESCFSLSKETISTFAALFSVVGSCFICALAFFYPSLAKGLEIISRIGVVFPVFFVATLLGVLMLNIIPSFSGELIFVAGLVSLYPFAVMSTVLLTGIKEQKKAKY